MSGPVLGEGCPYASTRVLEIFLAWLMVISGVLLMHPGDTFELPHYFALRKHMNEETGGMVFVATGLGRLAALWVNGIKRRTPVLRMIGCCIGCGFWIGMVSAMWQSAHEFKVYPMMLGVAIAVLGAEAYSALRCGADASYLRTFPSLYGKGNRHNGRVP